MRVPPFVRKLGLWALVGLGALILAAVLTAALFERQIGQRVLRAANDQLTTELEVEGFDLSFFQHFPNLTASLEGVSVLDREGGLLIQANEMNFTLSLLSFISAQYDIYAVTLRDGVLHLRYDEEGRPNYEIFRSDAPERTEYGQGESLAFSLNQAQLERIALDYEHAGTGRRGSLRLDDARFSGSFSARRILLESWAEGMLGFLETDGVRFFVNQPVQLEGAMELDLEPLGFRCRDLALQLGSSHLMLNGSVQQEDGGLRYGLDLAGDRVELDDLIQWLPQRNMENLRRYRAGGAVRLDGRLQGVAPPGAFPPADLRLVLKRGRLQGPLLADDLKDVAFVTRLTGGGPVPPRLEIDSLRAYFGRRLIEGNLAWEGMQQPELEASLNGILPVASLYPLFAAYLGHPDVEQGLGDIELHNLEWRGRFDRSNGALQSRDHQLRGRIVFDDTGLQIRGERIRFDRGSLSFEGNRLRWEDLKLEGPGTECTLHGEAFDATPLFFGQPSATEMSFTARLLARRIDLDALLALAPRATVPTDDTLRADSLARQRIAARARVLPRLRGTLEAEIESFEYDLVRGQDFFGNLTLDRGDLRVQGDMKAMDGALRLDGALAFREQPRLEARIETRSIDLAEAFRQMRDFGQDLVQSRHLGGQLNAHLLVDAQWDEAGRFLDDQLLVRAGVGITEGELNELGILEQFADYVAIEDLRQIRFADLEHYLEIRDRTVYLPVCFLQSNALNLALNGLHRFDGSYRYNLKLNAGQVLMDKLRAHDPDLQPKPARRQGFFNLYYTLRGDPNELEVEQARREVRDDFARSRQRLELIQRDLREAFGELPLIGEPDDWKDGNGEGGEFLDFDLTGGREGS